MCSLIMTATLLEGGMSLRWCALNGALHLFLSSCWFWKMALSVSYRCSVLFSVDQKLLLGTGCDPPLLGLFEKAAAASLPLLFFLRLKHWTERPSRFDLRPDYRWALGEEAQRVWSLQAQEEGFACFLSTLRFQGFLKKVKDIETVFWDLVF